MYYRVRIYDYPNKGDIKWASYEPTRDLNTQYKTREYLDLHKCQNNIKYIVEEFI